MNHIFSSCKKAGNILCSSLDETALIEGISDVIVIKHKSGQYRSSKFFVCFGSNLFDIKTVSVCIFINKNIVPNVKFSLDKYGYIQPNHLNSRNLASFNLKIGRNLLQYQVQQLFIAAEIYLYTDNDRLLISDFDGTLTKSDVGGLYNNIIGRNYLHDGYEQLINGIAKNGYKIVWITMRSLPLYNFSKKYIAKNVKVEGPLLMQPQQFFYAIKKQLLKQAANVKANIMKQIKSLFPININPFVGGLGNRETDAIAYKYGGISNQNIYLIDTKSKVHKLNQKLHALTYQQIAKQIQIHFPMYSSPKVGYI